MRWIQQLMTKLIDMSLRHERKKNLSYLYILIHWCLLHGPLLLCTVSVSSSEALFDPASSPPIPHAATAMEQIRHPLEIIIVNHSLLKSQGGIRWVKIDLELGLGRLSAPQNLQKQIWTIVATATSQIAACRRKERAGLPIEVMTFSQKTVITLSLITFWKSG